MGRHSLTSGVLCVGNPVARSKGGQKGWCWTIQRSFLVSIIGGRWYIITQLAIYKWYILAIGGLYITYYRLREPETAIEQCLKSWERHSDLYMNFFSCDLGDFETFVKIPKLKTYQFVCQTFPTSADENLHLQKSLNLSIPRIAQNILQERLQDTPRFLDRKCENADGQTADSCGILEWMKSYFGRESSQTCLFDACLQKQTIGWREKINLEDNLAIHADLMPLLV